MFAEAKEWPDFKWGLIEVIESRWSTSIRRKRTKIIAIAPRESLGKEIRWLPLLSFSYVFATSGDFSTPGWRRRRIIIPTRKRRRKPKLSLASNARGSTLPLLRTELSAAWKNTFNGSHLTVADVLSVDEFPNIQV